MNYSVDCNVCVQWRKAPIHPHTHAYDWAGCHHMRYATLLVIFHSNRYSRTTKSDSTYTYTHTFTHLKYIFSETHFYTHARARAYTHTRTHTHTHTHTHTYTHTHTLHGNKRKGWVPRTEASDMNRLAASATPPFLRLFPSTP